MLGYALSAFLTFLAMSEIDIITFHRSRAVRHLLRALWIGLPPAALIGAVVGYRGYFIAMWPDAKPGRPWLGVLLFLSVIVSCGVLSIPLHIQYLRRMRLSETPAQRSRWASKVFFLLMCVLPPVLYRPPEHHPIFIATGIASLLFSDSLTLNRLATAKNDGRLAPPATDRFQFSLGTLLFIVLALATYTTGMIWLFD